jgi:flagellin-like protein
MKPSDCAVSPIIGVIVMIIVTVILAGLVAAFVFSGSPPPSSQKIVVHDRSLAVVVNKPSPEIINVIYLGGPAHDNCNQIKATLFDINNKVLDTQWMAPLPSGKFEIGERVTFRDFTETGKVMVNASFVDGSEKMVFYDNPVVPS